MKTVLCYGDSNTWGADPASGGRYPLDVRWPGVLQSELGGGYRVIEEGLPGRTTVRDDPYTEGLNGRPYLLPCLWSHTPLDLVAIMLGTNDLKTHICGRANQIALGVGMLIDITLRSCSGPGGGAPRLLLIAPPRLGKLTPSSKLAGYAGSEEESAQLGALYGLIAEVNGIDFLDAGQMIVSSDIDGVHFEASEHRKLGKAVAAQVRQIFEPEEGA